MKQIFIAGNAAYSGSEAKSADLTTVGKGKVALFDYKTGNLLTKTAAIKDDFMVVLGDPSHPRLFPEVNFKTLTVTKATSQSAATFTAQVTVPTPKEGETYTIVVSKKGVVFNERSNWTFTEDAKAGDTATTIANRLVKTIKANSETLGVSATNSGAVITLLATEAGKDYNVVCADAMFDVKPASVTQGKAAILDKEYVKDLALACAAGKGFNYLGEDGKEIYPGFPEEVAASTYVMYTLRFAVPRKAAKQRDEVVYQLLHIVVPTGAACIADLDVLFGITAPAGA